MPRAGDTRPSALASPRFALSKRGAPATSTSIFKLAGPISGGRSHPTRGTLFSNVMGPLHCGALLHRTGSPARLARARLALSDPLALPRLRRRPSSDAVCPWPLLRTTPSGSHRVLVFTTPSAQQSSLDCSPRPNGPSEGFFNALPGYSMKALVFVVTVVAAILLCGQGWPMLPICMQGLLPLTPNVGSGTTLH
jgi:hypothetical protein